MMITAVLSIVLSEPALGCTSAVVPPVDVKSPSWSVGMTPDAGIWFELNGALLEDVELVDEEGQVVPMTTHQFAQMYVLFPEEPLVAGALYDVRTSFDSYTWRQVHVEDGATEPAQPPVAVRRVVVAEEWREIFTEGTGCYGGEYTGEWETVSYAALSVCNLDAWTVTAMSPTEPAAPALDDGIAWSMQAYWSSAGEWPDAGPGAAATVWLGAVDARGGFSGWVQEDLELPGAQERREDVLAGVPLDSTPTSWGDSCPSGEWVLGDIEVLDDLDAAKNGAEDAQGCGCATTPGGGAWGFLALGALAATRRRPAGVTPRNPL